MIKNLYELYNLIEKVSTALPNVNQFVNSFDSLNREDTSYAAVVLQFRDGTQATEGSVRYRFYLGYVDRVNENTDTPSTSNNILTQSIAEENIRLIINKLYPEVDITFGNTFYPFTQRFTALTAGCYVELAITLAVKDCNYESGSVLRDVEIVSDSNGVKEVVPGSGVDGFKKVIVRTEVPLKEEVTKDIVITENGNTMLVPEEGQSFSKVNIDVNVPVKTEVTKDIVITENGNTTYIPDSDKTFGVVNVDVNVPVKTEVAKDITITENGNTTYTPNEGEVFNRVSVDVNVPATIKGSVGWAKNNHTSKPYLDDLGNTRVIYDLVKTPFYTTDNVTYNNIYDNQGNQIQIYKSPSDGGEEIPRTIFFGTPPSSNVSFDAVRSITDYMSDNAPHNVATSTAEYNDYLNAFINPIVSGDAMFFPSGSYGVESFINNLTGINAMVGFVMTKTAPYYITSISGQYNQKSIIAIDNSYFDTGVGLIYSLDECVLYAGNTGSLMVLSGLEDPSSMRIKTIRITSNIVSAPDIPNGIKSVGTLEIGSDVTSASKLLTYTSIETYDNFPVITFTNANNCFDNASITTTEGWGVVFPNVTSVNSMFNYALKLKKMTNIFGSSITDARNMFNNCRALESIEKLDFSNVDYTSHIFDNCAAITTLGGFAGLKANLDLSQCTTLTKESLLNVINEAADVTSSPKTLTLGTENLNKLTDEEKAIATNKGWTLA